MPAQEHPHISDCLVESTGRFPSATGTSAPPPHHAARIDWEQKRSLLARLLQDLPELSSLRLTLSEGEVLIVGRAVITLTRTGGKRAAVRIQAIKDVDIVREKLVRHMLTTAEFEEFMAGLSSRSPAEN